MDLGEEHATALDAADPLAAQRARFRLPTDADGVPKVYLAGQSLGAQPVAARAAVEAALEAWATLGVDGHFDRAGWFEADDALRAATGRLVGAAAHELSTLNTLTVNLHLLLASFYRPHGRRTAILIDAPTFPSDRYAVDSFLRSHGRDPATDRIVVGPRDGEAIVRVEDLEAAIHEHRDRLALALLAGVNYATGQVHDVPRLTAAVRSTGAVAAWISPTRSATSRSPSMTPTSTWRPGAPTSTSTAARARSARSSSTTATRSDTSIPRLAGWWGNDPTTRFEMTDDFRPERDANGWRLSNPSPLALAPIAASLAIFDEVGMAAIRRKSVQLTGYFEALIDARVPDAEIITPRDEASRGAQLSLRLPDARARLAAIERAGVVGDFREPDILRLAPIPLYNSFHDAWRAADVLAATVR